jgi:ATP-dependent Zn protease
MNPNFRNFALWVIIILLVAPFINSSSARPSEIPYSELLSEAARGHVFEVTIAGNEITGHFTDNRAFATYAPNDPTLLSALTKSQISVTVKPPRESAVTTIMVFLGILGFLAAWSRTPRSSGAAVRPSPARQDRVHGNLGRGSVGAAKPHSRQGRRVARPRKPARTPQREVLKGGS